MTECCQKIDTKLTRTCQLGVEIGMPPGQLFQLSISLLLGPGNSTLKYTLKGTNTEVFLSTPIGVHIGRYLSVYVLCTHVFMNAHRPLIIMTPYGERKSKHSVRMVKFGLLTEYHITHLGKTELLYAATLKNFVVKSKVNEIK